MALTGNSNNLPSSFNFLESLLNGDHLHFGVWPKNKPDITGEEAQQIMFDTILGFLPNPPALMLSVYCGAGLSAAIMAGKGYSVTAIDPSEEIINYAIRTHEKTGVLFKHISFYDEDKEVFQDNKYDIILFQDSAQHIQEPDVFIKKARRLLKQGGLVIIADEVCYDRSQKPGTDIHSASAIKTALAENGFCIMENLELGDEVIKSFDYFIKSSNENIESLVSNNPEKSKNLNIFISGWEKRKAWHVTGQMGYEIFVARKDIFFMKPYTPGDETQILELFRKVFNAERSLEHWNWKFKHNPYGMYVISEAFSKDGRLVAHYGGYAVPFYNDTGVGPQTFITCQVGDTMTSPEVRNIGLGKTNLLSRTVYHYYAKFFEGQKFFGYGFNTGTHKILGKRYLGYSFLDEVIFRTRDIVKKPFKKPCRLRILKKFRVQEVDSFTSEWDAFFYKVCKSYKFLIRRDSQYLTWRYLKCPDNQYKIFSVLRGNKLTGWSIFLRKDSRLIWGDALFDARYPEAVMHLMHFLQKNLAGMGIDHIEGWFSRNPEWWQKILDEAGFEIKEEPNHLSFCFKTFMQPDMTGILNNFLYYTSGDGDLF